MASRVAARWRLAAYDPYAVAMVTTEDVLGRLRYTRMHPEADDEVTGMRMGGEEELSGEHLLFARARSWSFDRWVEWLEHWAAAYKIETLRKDVEENPLVLIVRNPKGRVIDKRPTNERSFKETEEIQRNPRAVWYGHTLEAVPRPPTDARKLTKLLKLRDQRLRDYAALYADLRKPKVSFEVGRRSSDDLVILVRDHNLLVGGMQATEEGISSDRGEVVNRLCIDDLVALEAVHGPGPVWMVRHAVLHPSLRGQHLGSKLYDTLLDALRGHAKYLVANRCFTHAGGDLTSDLAKKVWEGLRRRYTTSGFTLVVP